MRKILVLLLSLALVGITPAQAIVRAGAKCSTYKTSVTLNGFKFTCIKSGNKLIWSKGVAIKKASLLKQGVCPPKLISDKDLGITQDRANTLIGMSEAEAENCANTLQWGFRVGQRDGEDFPMTLDFRIDRVSVTSQNGLVTKVSIG